MKMVTLAIGGSDIELKYNDNKNGLGARLVYIYSTLATVAYHDR